MNHRIGNETLKLENKKAAAFGSYGWSGESIKLITKEFKKAGLELMDDEGLKLLWNPDEEEIRECEENNGTYFCNIT